MPFSGAGIRGIVGAMARVSPPPVTLVEAFVAVMPPECGGVPLDAFARAFWQVAPGRVRWGLHGVCLLLRGRAWLTGRGWARCTVDERRRLIAGLGASRSALVREVPALLKALAAQGAFGHPEGQRAFGLPVDASPPFWSP
jgi:hypothetical protein